MKTISEKISRRDRCYLVGRRGQRLNPAQAAAAWYHLSERIEGMGDLDLPKFNDLFHAFHDAARLARRTTGIPVENNLTGAASHS